MMTCTNTYMYIYERCLQKHLTFVEGQTDDKKREEARQEKRQDEKRREKMKGKNEVKNVFFFFKKF